MKADMFLKNPSKQPGLPPFLLFTILPRKREKESKKEIK